MNKYLYFILALLLPAQLCIGATYYCDLTEVDAGTGTTGDPWQLSQAEDSGNVSAGDTVYLRGTGATITITSNSDANGSAGSPIIFKQWVGETQAQFTSVVIDGSSAPFYEFNGLKVDAGTGTSWVVAVSENLSGSGGEITFDGCTIHGYRPTTYPGGDYYPYYFDTVAPGTNYTMSFTTISGITLTIKNSSIMHGRRLLNLSDITSGTVLIENNTFDRCSEDFISSGGDNGVDNATYRGNVFGETYPASRNYGKRYWPGSATGTWAGHEGETVTQDTTNASGIYVGQDDGRFYIVADDENNLPVRTDQDVWRLDSDSVNVYFTPSDNGDSAHNDHIQLQGYDDNVTVEKNLFIANADYDGNGLKLAGNLGDGIIVKNNVFNFNTPNIAYAIYASQCSTYYRQIVNNTIISKQYNSIRFTNANGKYVLTNNIIISDITDAGSSITASNNIYSGSDPYSDANSIENQDFTDSPSGNNRYFNDYTNGDYSTFDTDSPQIDAGSSSGDIPDSDYVGLPRPSGTTYDVGAYEFFFGTHRGVTISGGTMQ
jgi:hypothetical protein